MQIAANSTALKNQAKTNNKQLDKIKEKQKNNKVQETKTDQIKKKLPEQKITSYIRASNSNSVSLPYSYAMVISSYEHVFRENEVESDTAEQLGKTIENRLLELNKQALRQIEELSEYKKLEIDNIQNLGSKISDMITDDEDGLKAFALLKNPKFADLMESRDTVHKSFAEMMKKNGDEQLLFGALNVIDTMNNSTLRSTNTQPRVNLMA